MTHTTGSTPRTSWDTEDRITPEYAMTILSWIAPGEPIRLTKRELVALLDGVTMDYLALLDERDAATQRAARLERELTTIEQSASQWIRKGLYTDGLVSVQGQLGSSLATPDTAPDAGAAGSGDTE